MHCLCSMCRCVLLLVLWLLIGARSRHLVVWLLSIAEALCPSLQVSLFNDLSDPVFDGMGLAGFKSRANAFLLAWSALSFLSPTVSSFSSFHGLVVWDWGLWTDAVFSLSPGLAQRTPISNNNNTIRYASIYVYCSMAYEYSNFKIIYFEPFLITEAFCN